MNVDQVYGLLLIIVLFTHGISVPVPSSYFINEAPDQGLPVDDITESESYERFPRNAFSSPYNYVHENRWFPRSQLSARPRQPTRRHFHLFHLTAKHPNAVSYHVIQKPLVPRTISAPVKFGSNSRSNVPYNKRQYQPYTTSSYYQQPATYQYPGYTGSNSPYGQNRVQNSMYQDIYQEASNPMQFPSNPSSYTNQQTAMQNDKALEEAAKQFTRISADMNNMELASLVMYPLPRLHDSHHTKIHKKKHKPKRKNKKKNKSKVSKIKLERKAKTVNNLLHTLIKNEKNKNKDDDDDDKDLDYDGSGSGSADTWDEEDVASTGDQGYTSSKRSKIPHVIDTISNSDEDKTESSGDDASLDEHELDGASGQQESEFGGGYVSEDDVKDADSDNKKQSTKPQADVEETEDEQGSSPLQNNDDDEESGEQESEFGSGYVNESDVKDDDSENEKRNSEKKTIVKKSNDR